MAVKSRKPFAVYYQRGWLSKERLKTAILKQLFKGEEVEIHCESTESAKELFDDIVSVLHVTLK